MVLVKKKSGETEEFDITKLKSSLERAGASPLMADSVSQKIANQIYNGITTKELYDLAFKELKKIDYITASKYDLKGALLRLGKQGDVFEKYIAALLQKQKYKVLLNQIVAGECIAHEIDILATKGDKTFMVECKHHEKPWAEQHIQTALYVYARFLDIQKHANAAMLVTNTKVTAQALHYCNCKNISVISWNQPAGKGLNHAVEFFKHYPITIIQSIDTNLIHKLFNKNIILASQIEDGKILRDMGIKNWKTIADEAQGISQS